ncbi:hypothetical protein [Glaciibacter superstes]|uniref:hypothetical protein n=1 Tax=Glaciibacter superstes TaxID=501023 RepID=UPI0003B5C141|nr:hypothetical protein [Glaciibacter superstes]
MGRWQLDIGWIDDDLDGLCCERAALALAESVALIASDRVPDDVYVAAAIILSDSELAAVIWVAIVINSWNRIAVSSRYRVGPTD